MKVKLTYIKQLVERFAKVQITDGQHSQIAFARYVFIMLAVEEKHRVLAIAQYLGKDRTTVYHSLTQFDKLIQTNKIVKNLYLNCIAELTKDEQHD